MRDHVMTMLVAYPRSNISMNQAEDESVDARLSEKLPEVRPKIVDRLDEIATLRGPVEAWDSYYFSLRIILGNINRLQVGA